MDRGSWYCTGGGGQDLSQEKEMQKGKMVVWRGLTNSWEKKLKAKAKRKDTYLNAEFQRLARIDKIAFLSDQCREVEENNRMGKNRNLFKHIKGTFQARMGTTIKEKNVMDLTEAEDNKRWEEFMEDLY